MSMTHKFLQLVDTFRRHRRGKDVRLFREYNISRSKYMPHQGKREMTRRVHQAYLKTAKEYVS